MKAVFVADVPLNNPHSGSERVLYEQAIGLARKGVTVCALTRQNGAYPLLHRTVDGFVSETCFSLPTHSIPRFFAAGFRQIPGLFDRMVQGSEPAAAVCHHPFTYFFLMATGRLRRLPVVHVFHSPSHEEYLLVHEGCGRLRNVLPVLFRKWIETMCLRRAARTMVLSAYMAEKVRDLYGIPRERIVVNPGGVDLQCFRPPVDRTALKSALGLPKDRLHLFTVRNLEPRMGLDNLLHAMALLRAEKLPVHLVLGGDGPERVRLQTLVRELRLQESVDMAGFIPAERLSDHYGAADFFVLPTRRLEGFGLVTPEAMACGTPVVGTPVGGTCEILSRFNPELLFKGIGAEDIASGIRSAAARYGACPDRYHILRQRCRQYVEQHYSWERHVETLQATLVEAAAT
jgi:glycosyltransferase involved in cell wall biosynthesis